MQIEEWINGPAIKTAHLANAVEGYGGDWKVRVGDDDVTRIERVSHGGMHCDIPYIRIWKGDREVGQFCLHEIVGIEC